MVIACDVFTAKLLFLNRFMNLMFETFIIQCITSGQINLAVTCTADCTCHHLTLVSVRN